MTAGFALPFTDIHCHLLPDMDDGPVGWVDCLALARQAFADGVGAVIATPHQLGPYEATTAARICDRASQAQRRFLQAGIPLNVLPGADVRVREDLPSLVRERRVCTLGERGKYILVELPQGLTLPLGRLLHELDAQDVRLILSHPERQPALMHTPHLLHEWVCQGCLVQITAGSLLGDFGRDARRAAWRLLSSGLVHVVATDAHDTRRRPMRMCAAHALVTRLAGNAAADLLFIKNPTAIFHGEPVRSRLPIPANGRALRDWLLPLRAWPHRCSLFRAPRRRAAS